MKQKQMATMDCQLRDEGGNPYTVDYGDIIELDGKDERFVPIDSPDVDFEKDNKGQLMTKPFPLSDLRKHLERIYRCEGLKNKGKAHLVDLLLEKRE